MSSSAFIDASRLVTGQTDPVPALADTYETQFNKHPAAPAFLQACATALSSADPMQSIKAAMAAEPTTVGAAGKELVHLWFVGAPGPVPGPTGLNDQPYLTAETYFGALLWPVIGAHPPGLSGGYFGHWRYLPDE
jgi:hypothetical protein